MHPPWPYRSRHLLQTLDHAGCIIPSSSPQCRPGPPSGQPGPPSSATPCFAPYSKVSSSAASFQPLPTVLLWMSLSASKRFLKGQSLIQSKMSISYLKMCGVSAVEPGAWMCISFSAAPTRPGFLILATQALPLSSYCSQSGRRRVSVI